MQDHRGHAIKLAKDAVSQGAIACKRAPSKPGSFTSRHRLWEYIHKERDAYGEYRKDKLWRAHDVRVHKFPLSYCDAENE